jgi:beta-N-acetylhexosaminidase
VTATAEAILARVMLAFEGFGVPAAVRERLERAPAAGVTLFRHGNVRSPGQVRELADALQAAARDRLLVAADQEGGQLIALGEGSTPFAGNMALGAVDDPGLTERVGRAIGTEARAMGVNVVYAPVLDVASNPLNPALGIRAFGDDPAHVARHGAAMVRGLQAAGVAATVKHFPGAGEAADDPHHGVATVSASRAILDTRELVPFRAAVAAGARMTMSAHVALPAVAGRADAPSTLSRASPSSGC